MSECLSGVGVNANGEHVYAHAWLLMYFSIMGCSLE